MSNRRTEPIRFSESQLGYFENPTQFSLTGTLRSLKPPQRRGDAEGESGAPAVRGFLLQLAMKNVHSLFNLGPTVQPKTHGDPVNAMAYPFSLSQDGERNMCTLGSKVKTRKSVWRIPRV